MPITYTNRKGHTYSLCRVLTKNGQSRYVFSREPKGDVLEAVPKGYEVTETINGVVSLTKSRPRIILADELAAVETALKRHSKAGNYRATVKAEHIIVHEGQGSDLEQLMAMFGRSGPPGRDLLDWQASRTRFIPILRFTLIDRDKRLFVANRWHFSGSIDDWIGIGYDGRIDDLARKLIPALGTDRYFELGLP